MHDHDDELTRRDFLKLLGASIALAGLDGCTRIPAEKILPYVTQPPEVTPGVPLHYATSMVLDGYATGLVVESHEGRPTKVEGNPDHPASLGAAGILEQASVLQLYDPDRARAVRYGNADVHMAGVRCRDGARCAAAARRRARREARAAARADLVAAHREHAPASAVALPGHARALLRAASRRARRTIPQYDITASGRHPERGLGLPRVRAVLTPIRARVRRSSTLAALGHEPAVRGRAGFHGHGRERGSSAALPADGDRAAARVAPRCARWTRAQLRVDRGCCGGLEGARGKEPRDRGRARYAARPCSRRGDQRHARQHRLHRVVRPLAPARQRRSERDAGVARARAERGGCRHARVHWRESGVRDTCEHEVRRAAWAAQ